MHAHRERERDADRKKERKIERRSLYSSPALILFIQWICFSLRNPPLISFHVSLWSQFYRFTTSKSLSIYFYFSLFLFPILLTKLFCVQEMHSSGGGKRATVCNSRRSIGGHITCTPISFVNRIHLII